MRCRCLVIRQRGDDQAIPEMLANSVNNGAPLTDKPALHAAFAPVGATCTVITK